MEEEIVILWEGRETGIKYKRDYFKVDSGTKEEIIKKYNLTHVSYSAYSGYSNHYNTRSYSNFRISTKKPKYIS